MFVGNKAAVEAVHAGMGTEQYPQAEAVLVDKELHVYVTRGLRRCFQALAGYYVNYI